MGKLKKMRFIALLVPFSADAFITNKEANSFLSRKSRSYHDQKFESQCIEQDCSFNTFDCIVDNRADSSKLWNDFIYCAKSQWRGLTSSQRKEGIRQCLGFDQMVSNGQPSGKCDGQSYGQSATVVRVNQAKVMPKSRMEERNPWIDQIMKARELYSTIAKVSEEDINISNVQCKRSRRHPSHETCQVYYSTPNHACQIQVKVVTG